MCTGASYLGGYIGDDETKCGWIKDIMGKLERDIRDLRKTSNRYHQESYSAVVHSVQSEWIFLQSVMKEIGQAFTGLEIFLQETFLPHIFYGKLKILPPIVGALSTLPENNPEWAYIIL